MSISAIDATRVFPEDWHANLSPGPPFTLDAMHRPFPLSPLYASFTNDGFLTALREYRVPVIARESVLRNYYRFDRMVMAEPRDEEEAVTLFAPAEKALEHEVGRQLERWHGEHLPAVRKHLARLDRLDPALSELEQALDEVGAIITDVWTIHFRIVLPMMLAMQTFDELHADLFGGTDADAHALLVGELSESIKTGFGLSDLAQAARELGLAPVLLESGPDDLQANIERSAGGPDFLARLDEFLTVYGFRQDLFDYITSTWIEDPSFALAAIRTYLESERDLRRDHEATARSADAALEVARERLAAYPAPVRERFEAVLQYARHATFLQEEHNFYIDQQATARLRFFYLRIGQRLMEAGLIERLDDIMMLTHEELAGIAADPGKPGLSLDLRRTVKTRRQELDIARRLEPPPFLGNTPPSPPPFSNPMLRGTARFWGAPPEPSTDPSEIRGLAGAKGEVTGTARVVRTLRDAQALQPGEILVAITTMPPWTPLFAVAAAVVTETGGPLSHCAIVAREYGIPAVVGAPGATSRIATGQRIAVDGGTGIVTLGD
ncbi:MAG: hypothetical protein H0V37_03675 [Chloroflexia bacterium]|nr:hypothetical protein [Chloroflexia bacterium]